MLLAYLTWHYGRGLRQALGVAGNFLAFSLHFFALRELAATFFAPWRQVTFVHQGGLLTGATISALWGNFLSRILGAYARSLVIVAGSIFFLCMLLCAGVFIAGWLVGPLLPFVLFVRGLMMF